MLQIDAAPYVRTMYRLRELRALGLHQQMERALNNELRACQNALLQENLPTC